MAIVESFGEDRADLRAAVNTCTPPVTEENFDKAWEFLTDYSGDEKYESGLVINERALQMVKDQNE